MHTSLRRKISDKKLQKLQQTKYIKNAGNIIQTCARCTPGGYWSCTGFQSTGSAGEFNLRFNITGIKTINEESTYLLILVQVC